MKRVFIYCEGQSEERFVSDLLSQYFLTRDIYVVPIIATTKKTATKKYQGGVSKYAKIKSEVEKLCKSDKTALVTTFLDYYALPSDVPGRKKVIGADIYEKVEYIESKMREDINLPNYLPNIMLHEFEGLLFSNPKCFKCCDNNAKKIKQILEIRRHYETPEHINDGEETAPSKRIKKIFEEYDKVLDGVSIAIDIGLDKILEECTHFRKWIENICALAE